MTPLLLVFVAAELFELSGRFTPAGHASVSIHRVQSPYSANTMSEPDGSFTFRKLEPGAYTISIFLPAQGEARQTIEVGPGTADRKRRVRLKLALKDSDFTFQDPIRRRHAVSTRQLAISTKAVAEYEAAQRLLGKGDAEAAVKRLERAVEIAPQFASAWNNLGTIAYQTQKYARAAECFRQALEADPELYEPLVNLGGVLLNLQRPQEAYDYNLHAVLARPNDALASAQLGMTYFELGNREMAEKHLRKAAEIDPAHFSHPQLYLAEIHYGRGDRAAAADDLEDFLRRHPDWKQAETMRAKIAEWRGPE